MRKYPFHLGSLCKWGQGLKFVGTVAWCDPSFRRRHTPLSHTLSKCTLSFPSQSRYWLSLFLLAQILNTWLCAHFPQWWSPSVVIHAHTWPHTHTHTAFMPPGFLSVNHQRRASALPPTSQCTPNLDSSSPSLLPHLMLAGQNVVECRCDWQTVAPTTTDCVSSSPGPTLQRNSPSTQLMGDGSAWYFVIVCEREWGGWSRIGEE